MNISYKPYKLIDHKHRVTYHVHLEIDNRVSCYSQSLLKATRWARFFDKKVQIQRFADDGRWETVFNQNSRTLEDYQFQTLAIPHSQGVELAELVKRLRFVGIHNTTLTVEDKSFILTFKRP